MKVKKYDKNNNLIYIKDSDGYENWWKYDENNNIVHFKDSFGFESWKKYDKNNNLIYYKNTLFGEDWYKYDGNKKINIGLAISQNFDKVTLDLVDEPVEYENDEELEREIKKRFAFLRKQVFDEFKEIQK